MGKGHTPWAVAGLAAADDHASASMYGSSRGRGVKSYLLALLAVLARSVHGSGPCCSLPLPVIDAQARTGSTAAAEARFTKCCDVHHGALRILSSRSSSMGVPASG